MDYREVRELEIDFLPWATANSTSLSSAVVSEADAGLTATISVASSVATVTFRTSQAGTYEALILGTMADGQKVSYRVRIVATDWPTR